MTHLGDRAFAAAGQRLWTVSQQNSDNLTSASDKHVCSADVEDSSIDVQGKMWSSGLSLLALDRLPANKHSEIIGQ